MLIVDPINGAVATICRCSRASASSRSSRARRAPRWSARSTGRSTSSARRARLSLYGDVNQPSENAFAEDDITGAACVTDLEVRYQLMRNINLAVGANNIFDVYPNAVPLVSSARHGISSTRVWSPSPLLLHRSVSTGATSRPRRRELVTITGEPSAPRRFWRSPGTTRASPRRYTAPAANSAIQHRHRRLDL